MDTTFLQPTQPVVSTGYLDGLGRPIQTVQQDGSSYIVAATEYDAAGRGWRSWKPYTRTTAGYDPAFETNATDFYEAYHSVGTARPFVETQYTPDQLERAAKVIPEDTGSTASAFTTQTYGVDAASSQAFTEVTDESGKKTRAYTDLLGNQVRTILGHGSADSTVTNLAYNVLGQRTQATDPRGLVTTYTLDTRGLLTERTSPDAGTIRHKYDAAGNLRFTQDANQAAAGQVYFTTYDFADRPLVSGLDTATFSGLDPDGSEGFETNEDNWLVVRAYDAKPSDLDFPWSLFSTEIGNSAVANLTGRLAAVASRSNGSWQATLFSYDADGRVETRYTYTHQNGGTTVLAALNTTVAYTRNLQDAVTERALTVGTNTFNHWYEYDARGLLSQVFASDASNRPATADVTYTYRPSGELESRRFAGESSAVPLRYTIREQLEGIGDPATTDHPFSARYAYHPNGTVWQSEFYNAGSPAADKRYGYVFGPTSYDALNRIRSADFSSWNGAGWITTSAHDLTGIDYDAAGNITALQRYRENATLIDNLTYSYQSGTNRLSSISDAAGASAETWDAETGSFTYDANGNMKTAPAPYSVTAITYDHQNLPLSITSAGTSTSYRYGEAGQRIAKQVGSGNAEYYVLEGPSTLGVVTVNGSGTASAWHFNVLAGDKVVGRQRGSGARRHYHTDLLGSTRAVVEGLNVVESYDADPWGVLMPGRTLAGLTKEAFTGKEHDSETRLDYFGARFYMAALARWTAVDPLAEKHLEWSPYNYVLNNPLILIDPDGRQIRADLGDFNPFGAYGDVRRTADGRVESRLEEHKARAQGTLIGLSFVTAGLVGGTVGTAADLATGNFTLAGSALNFLPGGRAARGAVKTGEAAAKLGGGCRSDSECRAGHSCTGGPRERDFADARSRGSG